MHHGGVSQETRLRYEINRPNGQSPEILEETKEEKYLGVLISNNLKSIRPTKYSD